MRTPFCALRLTIIVLIFNCVSLSSVQACKDLLDIAFYNEDTPAPYCDGQKVIFTVHGVYLGGGISSDVIEDLTINTAQDYEWIDSYHIELTINASKSSMVHIKYYFEIIENQYEDGVSCSTSKYFTIDIAPPIHNIGVIKWAQGDILTLESTQENLCYQWGEVIDSEEMDIEGETNKSFTPESCGSLFVDHIGNEEITVKSNFSKLYYVKVSLCDTGNSQCDYSETLYFNPENFDYFPIPPDLSDKDIEVNIFPNPGDGIVAFKNTKHLNVNVPELISIRDQFGNSIPYFEVMSSWDKGIIDITSAASGIYILTFKIEKPQEGDFDFKSVAYVKQ